MTDEKMKELQKKLGEMESVSEQIREVEKALEDFDAAVLPDHDIHVSIGIANNSTYRVIVPHASESLINLVKVGFIAHLQSKKDEFKKMKL